MQIRLVFPFVDLRKLNINQTEYVVDKPKWTAFQSENKENPFVRCLGSLDNQFTECSLKRGISFYTSSGRNFIVRKRILNFPFGNSVFGQYFIVLDFYGKESNRMSTEEIIKMLGKDLKITVKYLFDNPQQTPPVNQITRRSVDLFNLKKEIHTQYYLSTIRFEEKKTRTKITDPNSTDSKTSINFLDPLISIDNSTFRNPLIGKIKYTPLNINIVVGMKRYSSAIFFDFRRQIGPFSFTRTKTQKANEIINAWLLFYYGFLSCLFTLTKMEGKTEIEKTQASNCIGSIMKYLLFNNNKLKQSILKSWSQCNENKLIQNEIIQKLGLLSTLPPKTIGSFEKEIQQLFIKK